MPKLRELGWLLMAGVLSSHGLACGGSTRTKPDELRGAGSTSGNGGTAPELPGLAGGSVGVPSSAGSTAEGGSAGKGASLGGTAGAAGAAAGAGTVGGAGGTQGTDGGSGGAAEETTTSILFDGTSATFNEWGPRNGASTSNPWQDNGDGTMSPMSSSGGGIISKQKFRNVFVHLEYRVGKSQSPDSPEFSCVGLNSSYGLQISDSYGFPPSIWTCGAVTGALPPLAVACRDHDQWNTYEIEFQAPICGESGGIVTPARFVEVTLNGTLIHRNIDVLQQTVGLLTESCEPRGLILHDAAADAPPAFRNIWAIPRD